MKKGTRKLSFKKFEISKLNQVRITGGNYNSEHCTGGASGVQNNGLNSCNCPTTSLICGTIFQDIGNI